MKIIITGGAGFIGSALIRQYINETDHQVINIDALTYAGNLESLSDVQSNSRYCFEKADVRDKVQLEKVFNIHQPDAVMHLAAESHVDRSIDGPADFIQTNIVGTYNLLDVSKQYWQALDTKRKKQFRFHHISTDEVYGSLGDTGLFTEETPYQPRSPYSASKASSDHLVRAWFHTYGFPVLITNCSNNYGPYQFPEKLIPLVILNAVKGEPLPIYGKGENVRDWLYVDDHTAALRLILEKGKTGETYNIGGCNEKTNIEVVTHICNILDEMLPESKYKPHRNLITYVADRPGHDLRYAIDSEKLTKELSWKPQETFETGLYKTVKWYMGNNNWCQRVLDGSYKLERLGLQEEDK